jgi:hypothetical protein
MADSNLASDSTSKPELRHVEHQLLLVEETHDDLLAEERRQAGDAEVDVAVDALILETDLDAAVLRQALLRDVELRHDLDARRDRIAELHRRLHDVVEQTVDAVADAQFLLVGLDVDVAGALLDRRHQDDVHELDDRRFLALLGERLGADLLELVEDLDVAGSSSTGMFSSAWLAASSALGPACAARRGARGGHRRPCRSSAAARRRPRSPRPRPARRCSPS